ncbi:MAG: DNA-binding response regulator [Gammaproteobacteria bacterium]|nr:MAG: DNA-binding response regulator [Gammaproteobacteria bacterium]
MKLLIIDDHPLFLEGIGLVLRQLGGDFETIEVDSAPAGLQKLEEQPDIALVLVDISMPGMSGFDFIEELEQRQITTPVAILSATTNLYDVKKAIEMGALGFIPKASDKEEMRHALETIFSGEVYIPPGIEDQLEALMAADDTDPEAVLRSRARQLGITRRQLQVLQLLAKGYTNRRIAEELNLTERTVKAHVSALFSLLNVGNRTECVLEADRLGLTSAPEQRKEFTLSDE